MADYKVMVPLDGSRLAEHSLVYLNGLKRLDASEVLLVSVVDESEDFRGLSAEEAMQRETNLLSTYLREVSSDIENHLNLNVQTRVVSGNPATRLLDEAESYQPDLLVISTHGRSGASRWRLGSVADKVIRSAACNTLVIGPHATGDQCWSEAGIWTPFTNVMVPLDGSALAEEALNVATPIAQAFDARLHLVRAVPIPIMADAYGEATYTPDLLNALIEGAKDYLRYAAGRLTTKHPISTASPAGAAANQLEEYSIEHGIDLVIMTSHGRSGFVRTALGSVTDRMLGGPAPVLIVRSSDT